MESSIGYAQWVCHTLVDTKLDKKSDLYRFNIVQMNALPAAMVAIGKYAGKVKYYLDSPGRTDVCVAICDWLFWLFR